MAKKGRQPRQFIKARRGFELIPVPGGWVERRRRTPDEEHDHLIAHLLDRATSAERWAEHLTKRDVKLDDDDVMILNALADAQQLLHYADLAQRAKRSERTCKRRMKILERDNLVSRKGTRGGFGITQAGRDALKQTH